MREGHHEGGSDLNLRAGSDVRDRYHVEAAQEFFVENRRLAAVNRVLVSFAGLRLRDGLADERAAADLRDEVSHDSLEGGREGDRGLDRPTLVVPEQAGDCDRRETAQDLDRIGRALERDRSAGPVLDDKFVK